MAKGLMGTLLTIALKLLTGKNKTTKQTSFKSAPAGTTQTAKTGSAGTLPKNVEIIKFGPYEWRVLERKGNTTLIIMERLLKNRDWNEKDADIRWENCTLRAYLNGEFYNSFAPGDQSRIVEVTNETPPTYYALDGKKWQISGGGPSNDKVFLLSLDEALRYFGNSTSAFNEWYKTKEAVSLKKIPLPKGFRTDSFSDKNDQLRVAILPASAEGLTDKQKAKGDIPYEWWLRSRGGHRDSCCAAKVLGSGKVDISGSTVKGPVGGNAAVRPALWLKM